MGQGRRFEAKADSRRGSHSPSEIQRAAVTACTAGRRRHWLGREPWRSGEKVTNGLDESAGWLFTGWPVRNNGLISPQSSVQCRPCPCSGPMSRSQVGRVGIFFSQALQSCRLPRSASPRPMPEQAGFTLTVGNAPAAECGGRLLRCPLRAWRAAECGGSPHPLFLQIPGKSFAGWGHRGEVSRAPSVS
jgi:hypothetical protein